MNNELKEAILEYNKNVAERREKAADLDILVSAIAKLPFGQLKKVLSQEVIDVLRKYGIEM